MTETSSKAIWNGIIATVIGGVILSMLVDPVGRFFTQSLKSAWLVTVWLWNFLFDRYPVPGWLLLVFSILALPALFRIAILCRRKTEPKHSGYRRDLISGAVWRWEWSGDDDIANLQPFCPTCDCELVYDDSSVRNINSLENKTDFLCENCRSIIASILGGGHYYATDAIKREIRRRVRTGRHKMTATCS